MSRGLGDVYKRQNIAKDAVDKVRTQVIEGRKCLIIDLDDPEISVNGMPANIE